MAGTDLAVNIVSNIASAFVSSDEKHKNDETKNALNNANRLSNDTSPSPSSVTITNTTKSNNVIAAKLLKFSRFLAWLRVFVSTILVLTMLVTTILVLIQYWSSGDIYFFALTISFLMAPALVQSAVDLLVGIAQNMMKFPVNTWPWQVLMNFTFIRLTYEYLLIALRSPKANPSGIVVIKVNKKKDRRKAILSTHYSIPLISVHFDHLSIDSATSSTIVCGS
jgi:hypothetical protein